MAEQMEVLHDLLVSVPAAYSVVGEYPSAGTTRDEVSGRLGKRAYGRAQGRNTVNTTSHKQRDPGY